MLQILNGYKTYIAAIGLVGLAIYQLSTGAVELAVQSLLAALAAFGLRHAIARDTEPVSPPPPEAAKDYRSPPHIDPTHMGVALLVGLFLVGESQAEFRVSDSPSLDGSRIDVIMPTSQHIRNRGGSDGAGLCVFASISHAGNYQSEPVAKAMFEYMFRFPGGGYPEKVKTMFDRCAKSLNSPVPLYIQHTGGDAEFLRLALRTGRYPCVTYAGRDGVYYRSKVAHMVNLVKFDDQHAVIHDNNFPGKWLWMSPSEFTERWRDMGGGWAVVLLAPPPTPIVAIEDPTLPHADVDDTSFVCWRPRRALMSAGQCQPASSYVPSYVPSPAYQPGGPYLMTPPQYPVVPASPLVLPPSPFVPQLPPNYPGIPDSCPDGKCPRAPGGQVIFGAAPQPKVDPMDADPFPGGVSPDQIPKERTYELQGQQVDRERAFNALTEAGLVDDSKKGFVTLVHPDQAVRQRFRDDWMRNNLLTKFAGQYHANTYSPDDWHVGAAGLKQGVTVQTSMTADKPQVIAHVAQYDGPEKLAKTIEGSEKIDMPALPSNPLDWRQWAIFGVLFAMAWFKERVASGAGLLARLFARRKPQPLTPEEEEVERSRIKRILDELSDRRKRGDTTTTPEQ